MYIYIVFAYDLRRKKWDNNQHECLQVAAFLSEMESRAAAAEATGGARLEGAAALWGVLRIMACRSSAQSMLPGARKAKEAEAPGEVLCLLFLCEP